MPKLFPAVNPNGSRIHDALARATQRSRDASAHRNQRRTSSTSVVITGCDSMSILQQALDAARSFRPMSKEQVAALLAKTAGAAQNGRYESYKTSNAFDATHYNPKWLG